VYIASFGFLEEWDRGQSSHTGGGSHSLTMVRKC
jgi:hypothetical protein